VKDLQHFLSQLFLFLLHCLVNFSLHPQLPFAIVSMLMLMRLLLHYLMLMLMLFLLHDLMLLLAKMLKHATKACCQRGVNWELLAMVRDFWRWWETSSNCEVRKNKFVLISY
jgi:hypothetical protein